MFIQNVEELQMRDLQVGESRDARIKRRAGSDDEGGEGKDKFDDIEEFDEEAAKESVGAFKPKRAAVPAGKKDVGDDDDDDEEDDKKPKGGLLGGIERSNPNHEKKAERMLKVKDLDGTAVPVDAEEGMNRKERCGMMYFNRKFIFKKKSEPAHTTRSFLLTSSIASTSFFLAILSAVLEAARKKEEYQRRHMAGETEGAQREIAQLAIVKARREAAAK